MNRKNNIDDITFTSMAELSRKVGHMVEVCGIVHKIRRMTGFAFVILRVGEGMLQCVYGEFSCFPLDSLQENMAVAVTGLAVEDQRSRQGIELRLIDAEILSCPAEQPPVVINGREVNASLETLLDYRPLTLRNPKERAIFRIQAELCRGIRTFLDGRNFMEIHTPKLVSGTAEGGANVFPLDYFGREAFLTQSPQFYKQMMVGIFPRVYEIGPVFRAEKHDTSRHINEYTSIDLEMGFLRSYDQLMRLETALLREAFGRVRENCVEEIALLRADIPDFDEIPALTFAEAKEMVARAYNRPITDQEDFEPEEERLLGELIRRQTGSELVFVTRYRSSKRPFYTLDSADDPTVTESFDLIFRGMEVTTGGQRIHSWRQQVEKMERRGMDVSAFEHYLMAHKYGLPPHGGMGIGLERLTARLLGFDNVRRAALFPRDIRRLTP